MEPFLWLKKCYINILNNKNEHGPTSEESRKGEGVSQSEVLFPLAQHPEQKNPLKLTGKRQNEKFLSFAKIYQACNESVEFLSSGCSDGTEPRCLLKGTCGEKVHHWLQVMRTAFNLHVLEVAYL